MTLPLEDYDRARRDPVVFADLLIGQPLWEHQVEVVRSTARYRVLCAGRRSGKTRVFGCLALHQGFAVRESKVLIISATDRSAKRMLADIAGMARHARQLAASVDDESTSRLVLTNGSEIECVPASMGAVRSAEADLLIVDEAGFVDDAIWQAAEPTVISRPGSRVLICSTPWGSPDHFFRALWTRGMDAPDEQVTSWHWPSSISPMVDEALLEEIRGRSSAEYFEREYLAVFGDVSGAYLTSDDLDAAIEADVALMPPAWVRGTPAVGGVDWGQARDASTLVVVTIDEEASSRRPDGRPVYRVAWVSEWFGEPYHQVVAEITQTARRGLHGRGFDFTTMVAEANGVGAMPSEELARGLAKAGVATQVLPLMTTTKTKSDAFGLLRMLLQQRRMLLPRHDGLLRQLRALRFEELPAGGLRISVPDAVGHDDLAMGLCCALHQLVDLERRLSRPVQLHERWGAIACRR